MQTEKRIDITPSHAWHYKQIAARRAWIKNDSFLSESSQAQCPDEQVSRLIIEKEQLLS